ncbi:NADP-dependent oxidoreductase [Agromyces tardus]|uniref:NADP-dependent oxidoreductase n=1 Tax=Agromyces tardus TaxID=2583849 RepID=A0A3M8A4U4_9MICO|nr:NADP-dependent oxidoreductase [Agromyces tardus]RNB46146.1 NADP-dependent oxidoreductase [Agromyces tardus]
MPHAVRYTRFGGPEVLEVGDIAMPEPGAGEVLVEVFATGLNPAESSMRRGDHPERWPVELPAAQGRDLAGVVVATGPGVFGFSKGDEVMGYSDRGAQATHVVVPEGHLLAKPPAITWEVAGSLYTAGTIAWSAVEGLALASDDTIVVTAAAGGVGCLAAQFARMRGATVVGTSVETRFDFLAQFGVIPTGYGPGLADRVRALVPGPVTAFLDFLGGQAAEALALGVAPSRITTVLDWDAVDEHGVRTAEPGDLVALGRVAALVAAHRVRLPIADVFPVDRVADAYRALDRRDAPGKIVLGFRVVGYPGERAHEPELKEQDVTLGVLTPHDHIDVEEDVPHAIGDGSVRRRHREERERAADAAAAAATAAAAQESPPPAK